MKKNRLSAVYEFDFALIGIVSTVKEYKLAWYLNQHNLFRLVKAEDIKIEFTDNKFIRVSNLIHEDDYSLVHLLRNKLVSSNNGPVNFLVPELSQFDYLLKLRNTVDENWSDLVFQKIKDIDIADYITRIEVEKIKQKENLLF